MAENPDKPLVNRDTKGKELNKEKKRCDVCDKVDEAYLLKLCAKCREKRVHSSCAKLLLQCDPYNWLCEKCRATSDKPDHSDGQQTPLSPRSTHGKNKVKHN